MPNCLSTDCMTFSTSAVAFDVWPVTLVFSILNTYCEFDNGSIRNASGKTHLPSDDFKMSSLG